MQQITHEMLVTIAEYDGWKISEEYDLPQVVYRKGNDQVEVITTGGKENEFFSRNMKYGTSMDWLHPAAMRVCNELIDCKYNDISDITDRCETIHTSMMHQPIGGQYIDLLNAAYEAILFINQNKQATGKPDNV